MSTCRRVSWLSARTTDEWMWLERRHGVGERAAGTPLLQTTYYRGKGKAKRGDLLTEL